MVYFSVNRPLLYEFVIIQSIRSSVRSSVILWSQKKDIRTRVPDVVRVSALVNVNANVKQGYPETLGLGTELRGLGAWGLVL